DPSARAIASAGHDRAWRSLSRRRGEEIAEVNQPHRQVRFHALATIATLIALGCAAPASAAVFGQYDFNSFGDAISNPSTPNVVSFPGVFVSSLDRDAGGDGNGDGLGTITATATRDSTPDVFTSTALAIG